VSKANNIKALYIFPDKFGANNYLMLDDIERFGWDITLAGTSELMKPCGGAKANFGASDTYVDVILTDSLDITEYDCLIIGPASWQYGDAYGDLMASESVMKMINKANDSGKIIYATCAGVRVLAKSGILVGKNVTGRDEYKSEFIAGGANYLGTGILPVIDRNIVTSSRGLYFHLQNSQAIATALEEKNKGKILTNENSQIQFENNNIENAIWSKVIGGEASDGFTAICENSDGSLKITGYTYSLGEGNSDLLIVKTDSDGNKLWSKTIGSPGWEYGNSICATNEGDYVITGYVFSDESASKDVLILKIDSNGNILWQKEIGGSGVDVGMSVCVADDNSYVICGYTESFGSGEDDVYLIKISKNGDILWSKTFGGEQTDRSNSVIKTNDGNLALVGSTGSYGTGNMDVYFIKVNQNGTELLVNSFNDSNFDMGTSVSQTKDGGYIISGNSDYYESEPMDVYLLKLNSLGEKEWDTKFKENIFYDYGNSVKETDDGGFIICGASKFHESSNEIYFVKTDAKGKLEWKKLFGGISSDWGNSIIQTQDNNYVIVGNTKSFPEHDQNGWVFKISNIFPKFNFTPKTGHAPLKVEFIDSSFGNVIDWKWDVDGNGLYDFYEQNPVFTFETPGVYNPSLSCTDGTCEKKIWHEDMIKVFNGESALLFSNNQNKVIIPPAESINLTESFTIEAWIHPTGWGSSVNGEPVIMSKNAFELYMNKKSIGTRNPNSMVLALKNIDGTISKLTTSDSTFQFNQWQHIAATYDASTSEAHIVINGIDQAILPFSVNPSGALLNNEQDSLIIGNNQLKISKPFEGLIDEVRIWKNAKTVLQIKDSFKKYLSSDESDLVGYWQFNEGNGLQVTDKTNFKNDGKINEVEWEQSVDITSVTSLFQDNPNNLLKPNDYILYQNFPNPFNPTTIIKYGIPEQSNVKIEIFNILGQTIEVLVNAEKSSGYYEYNWNASNLPSGMYLVSIRSEGLISKNIFTQVKKALLLK